MKKAVVGMLVVLVLSFGSVPMGESATKSHVGCIANVFFRVNSSHGKVAVAVYVGNKSLIFWEGKVGKIRIGGNARWLTAS